MGMVSEFKEFIARGNVVDLAVGVVIGAAFGKIVTVAFAIFLLVRAVNRLHRKPDAAPAAPPEDVLLLREIRDALKK